MLFFCLFSPITFQNIFIVVTILIPLCKSITKDLVSPLIKSYISLRPVRYFCDSIFNLTDVPEEAANGGENLDTLFRLSPSSLHGIFIKSILDSGGDCAFI